MPPIIDAHQHNWQLERFSYAWIKPESPLHRDYLPTEARREMDLAGIEACVLVEADNSFQETAWLLEQAERHAHIAGVVGWADVLDPAAIPALAVYADHAQFKGVRMGWFEPKDNWETIATTIGLLNRPGLSCDLLLNPPALPQLKKVIARNPGVTFVLDHFAGAKIAAVRHTMWAAGIQPLAEHPNVVLKVSGYMTAYPALTPEVLEAYLGVALEAFGADRLLYGSDWPVSTSRGHSYRDSLAALLSVIETLSPGEQAAILGGTATRVYRLDAGAGAGYSGQVPGG